MANQRSKDQVILAFTSNRELSKLVDETSRKRGENRSEFIRKALINELKAMGITVPASLGFAPDRRAEPVLRVADSMDSPEPDIAQSPRKKVNYREAIKADRKKRK